MVINKELCKQARRDKGQAKEQQAFNIYAAPTCLHAFQLLYSACSLSVIFAYE